MIRQPIRDPPIARELCLPRRFFSIRRKWRLCVLFSRNFATFLERFFQYLRVFVNIWQDFRKFVWDCLHFYWRFAVESRVSRYRLR